MNRLTATALTPFLAVLALAACGSSSRGVAANSSAPAATATTHYNPRPGPSITGTVVAPLSSPGDEITPSPVPSCRAELTLPGPSRDPETWPRSACLRLDGDAKVRLPGEDSGFVWTDPESNNRAVLEQNGDTFHARSTGTAIITATGTGGDQRPDYTWQIRIRVV